METTISLEGLITIAISVLGGVIWLLSLVFGLRSEVKSLTDRYMTSATITDAVRYEYECSRFKNF